MRIGAESCMQELISDQLLRDIKLITGVVEVGLFCNMARAAFFGNEVSLPPHTCCVRDWKRL